MTSSFVFDAVRTPFGRAGGALSGIRPDDLAAVTLRAIVERTGLDPARIDDVLLGDANQAGEDNRNVARFAALLAGFPTTVPGFHSTSRARTASMHCPKVFARTATPVGMIATWVTPGIDATSPWLRTDFAVPLRSGALPL